MPDSQSFSDALIRLIEDDVINVDVEPILSRLPSSSASAYCNGDEPSPSPSDDEDKTASNPPRNTSTSPSPSTSRTLPLALPLSSSISLPLTQTSTIEYQYHQPAPAPALLLTKCGATALSAWGGLITWGGLTTRGDYITSGEKAHLEETAIDCDEAGCADCAAARACLAWIEGIDGAGAAGRVDMLAKVIHALGGETVVRALIEGWDGEEKAKEEVGSVLRLLGLLPPNPSPNPNPNPPLELGLDLELELEFSAGADADASNSHPADMLQKKGIQSGAGDSWANGCERDTVSSDSGSGAGPQVGAKRKLDDI